MRSTTFYKKEQRGKSFRYVPVQEYDSDLMDSLPQGSHLIVVKPGSRSTLYNVVPDYAAMIAVGRSKAINVLCEAMMEASKLRPKNVPVTEKQRSTYNAFQKAMGGDTHLLQYESCQTIAEKAWQSLMEDAAALKLDIPQSSVQ